MHDIYIYIHTYCVYMYIYTHCMYVIYVYMIIQIIYIGMMLICIYTVWYIYTHTMIYIYMAGVAMYISGTSLCVTSTGEFSSGERLCPDCALLGVEDGGWSLAFSAGLCRCVPSKDCWGDNPWIFRGPQ